MSVEAKGYARPEVLVDADWVAAHKDDANVKLVEVDVDTNAYDEGHIAGAVSWNWTSQLNDQIRRDIPSKEQLEQLLSASGIKNDDTVILYGDNNNWFAAFAFWILKMYGHQDVRLMDGGRKKWVADGRELTTQAETPEASQYVAQELDTQLRSSVTDILKNLESGEAQMVDVRSPAEFTGEVIAPPGMTETAQRGGHIPGAKNIPWAQTVNEDGTFKDADALRELYGAKGIQDGKATIAYCRIGERSSHTWFVLKYLLGNENVKNYDGSWTEYGSMVGVPIEKP
ncbi:MAG: thiosulfate/3-mercaptopyruvate sulfurtransferase [Abditibacteriota bacterium]|nr:thiosulfate/3-mercaptopyruvate sulfurtransferase [Abditibacteriota bacterium]